MRNASETEVDAYLNKYKGEAIADRLRNDWLLIQGKNENWASFDRHFPLFELADDMQVKCYALLSASAKGQNVADDARKLLTTPKNMGKAVMHWFPIWQPKNSSAMTMSGTRADWLVSPA